LRWRTRGTPDLHLPLHLHIFTSTCFTLCRTLLAWLLILLALFFVPTIACLPRLFTYYTPSAVACGGLGLEASDNSPSTPFAHAALRWRLCAFGRASRGRAGGRPRGIHHLRCPVIISAFSAPPLPSGATGIYRASLRLPQTQTTNSSLWLARWPVHFRRTVPPFAGYDCWTNLRGRPAL